MNVGTMTRIIALALLAVWLAIPAQAQFNAQATAGALHYNGTWNLTTTETEALPLIYWGASKGNSFSIGAREIIVPSLFDVYGGVGTWQPDLSAILKKTTLNPDQFTLSVDLMGGAAIIPTGNKPALEGRVNFAYAFTPNTALTGAYAGGGLIGSNGFYEVSAGLEYIFNPAASPNAAVKRMLARRAALKVCK